MERTAEISRKFIACFVALFFAVTSATAYGADDANGSSVFRMDANAAAAGSNPQTGRDFSFAIKEPEAGRPPMSGGEKFRYFLENTYDVESSLFTLAASGMNQARDTVPQWGQGMEGFGKRFASAYGRRSMRSSMQMGLGILLHEDPRYFPSNRSGIWKRTLYATSRVFVAQKDDGGIRPGYTRFIGAFGSAYISRQWHPESYHTPEDYFSAGAASLGLDIARNIFREFWPDLKRVFRP